MALEQVTFNIGALEDSLAGGKNYISGEIYEVFNTNDTLASIYMDAAGLIAIVQDGISNVSNSDGEVNFYIASGSYYLVANSKRRYFTAGIEDLLINDLSQAYEFDTVAEYKAFTTAFPAGKTIKILDRNAEFTVIPGVLMSNDKDVVASSQVDQSIELITQGGINVIQMGYTAGEDLAEYITAGQAAGHSVILVPELPEGASYTASSRYDTTAAIIIDFTGAKINITHNDDFIRLQHANSKTVGGFFAGTGKSDTTKPLQAAVRIWPGTVNCIIDSPICTEFAGDVLAGAIVITNTVLNHQGNRILNPTMYENNIAINLGNKGEYNTIEGGSISKGNNVAIRWEGGNNVVSNVTISDNVVAIDLIQSSNDSHGSLDGCTINHNTTPFRIGAINTKQFMFNGCHIYFGTGELNGCEGVVFANCEMGNLIINEDGCRNCFVVCSNLSASISPSPNHNGNASEVFYLDTVQPITVSAKTSSRLNGLRVFADNNGTGTIPTGRSQYIFPRVSQQIPYNPAYTVQQVYDISTGDFNAEEFKCRGGFEVPVDIRLSLSKTVAWDIADVQVYLEDIDTGARIAELIPQTLSVVGSNNIRTYQFSGIVDKKNLGLFVENNSGSTMSTFSNQDSNIRSYWLSTIK